ncbi:Putative phage abortive infection protein [Trichlorobacter thiogenes]|uniref:Putative phage abortive infection protein n=1 Tax=Trichlorobacter thiogenes TaxID=115783 RepID=A0A1T4QEU9_9BACT|nr:putative phage abortive infection protein [Trichlorobacter thiogenes]SKA02031.1 Putative phage abortive infection protein [Trichlorobacter thiogenes]
MFFKKFGKWIDSKYPQFDELFHEEAGESALTNLLYKLLVFSAVAAICLLALDLFLLYIGKKDYIGVFGDFFGGVLNPVLTFLTFFGLIATIVIQRQELKFARVEYEKTSEALNRQAVETTFFNILDLHHKIVDNIKVDIEELNEKTGAATSLAEIFNASMIKKKTIVEGRGAFDEIFTFITSGTSSPDEVLARYKKIQDKSNHILGHYFRNLYQALKLIDNYDKDKATELDKRKFAGILRAQLSAKELALLFINCLDGVCDRGQFKNLLIEYAMLEHLPIEPTENGYSLAGSSAAIASDEMFLQYKEQKNIRFNFEKCYGGAFGQNGGVPYDLRPSNSDESRKSNPSQPAG